MKSISDKLYGLIKGNVKDVPISSAVIDCNGNILAIAKNVCEDNNLLYHAELVAINNALKDLYDLSNCTLVTTLEPCLMCYGAAINANISKIVYFARNLSDGAFSYYHADTQKHNIIIEYIEDERFSNIIKNFFKDKR